MRAHTQKEGGGGHAPLENFSNFNRGSEMPFTAFSADIFSNLIRREMQ